MTLSFDPTEATVPEVHDAMRAGDCIGRVAMEFGMLSNVSFEK